MNNVYMLSTIPQKFDIIIVGAGPSGSATAYHLASQGLRVVLLDQKAFPRYKPCGGGIPVHTLEQLPFDLRPALEFCAEGGRLTFNGQEQLKAPLNREYVWLAAREKMDFYLLEKARAAGVDCRTGERVMGLVEEDEFVSVQTADAEYRAAYLVGADGVNSITARKLSLLTDRRTGTAIEAELKVSAQALETFGKFGSFDFGALPKGYGWVFPKRDHLSVGVFQANTHKASNLRQELQRFIDSQPELVGYTLQHIQGHRIPLGGRDLRLNTRRCLLVGDAANLADPWLGEGIYYALYSAGEAAQAILAHRDGSGSLDEYSAHIGEHILTDFKYARRIGWLVFHFPRLSTWLISGSRSMQQDVFLKIRGDLTHRHLWNRMKRTFPRYWIEALSNRGR